MEAGGPKLPRPRSTVVVTMTNEQATGIDPSPVRQVGGGLLAPSVLEQIFCGAELVGHVTDQYGQVLSQGRKVRMFTDEQVLAMIARDKGCARCGAHYSECDAHHIIPYNSPARGPTDIDNGAMLCSDCHHHVHEHGLILVRDPVTGTWSARPAKSDEIAPKRRESHGERSPESESRPRRKPSLNDRRRTGALW
jgi:hypothetical protein